MTESESSNEEISAPRRSVYVSAVDWWIAGLLALGPLICVVNTAILLQQGRGEPAMVCLIAGAVTLLVTGLFTVPCRYTILSDTLTIRCGVIFFRVPLDQIKEIEKSGSWLSGPALSLRRVRIRTASRFYLVSPAERERFIEELTQAVESTAK